MKSAAFSYSPKLNIGGSPEAIGGNHWVIFDYRHSFQGQESDSEIKGDGNSINYKYRMHDPRIGRFFAVDPLAAIYCHNSPYAFSENRVVDGVELEGLEFGFCETILYYYVVDYICAENGVDIKLSADVSIGAQVKIGAFDVNGGSVTLVGADTHVGYYNSGSVNFESDVASQINYGTHTIDQNISVGVDGLSVGVENEVTKVDGMPNQHNVTSTITFVHYSGKLDVDKDGEVVVDNSVVFDGGAALVFGFEYSLEVTWGNDITPIATAEGCATSCVTNVAGLVGESQSTTTSSTTTAASTSTTSNTTAAASTSANTSTNTAPAGSGTASQGGQSTSSSAASTVSSTKTQGSLRGGGSNASRI